MLIISVAFSETISAQNVAVRNNLLYDLTLTPNLGIDVKLGDQWSGGLSAGFNPWPTSDNVSRKWRHLLIAPQLRYWTKGVFEDRSTYWALNLIYSHYNVADVKFPFGMYSDVRDKRLQGDLAICWSISGSVTISQIPCTLISRWENRDLLTSSL